MMGAVLMVLQQITKLLCIMVQAEYLFHSLVGQLKCGLQEITITQSLLGRVNNAFKRLLAGWMIFFASTINAFKAF